MNPIPFHSLGEAPAEKITGGFAVFGNPVAQSLSPLMHNAAFTTIGISATYRAIRADDAVQVVRMVRKLDLRGASVTIPFKESLIPLLDEVERNALEIGAVNTILNREERLFGYNTDAPGLARDLEEWCGIRGRSFAVVGAGGAARAAVFAIIEGGGRPVVINRTAARARELADRFGCTWAPFEELTRMKSDVLINTTPVGMFPDTDRTPVAEEWLPHFSHVLDMIYNPLTTRLLREAQSAGCKARAGVGMFVHQGAEQIRLWTGEEPPREIMRQAVLYALVKSRHPGESHRKGTAGSI